MKNYHDQKWGDQTDWTAHENALSLADSIKRYWLRRGFEIDVRIEPASMNKQICYPTWGVRSDMVNGLPVRRCV